MRAAVDGKRGLGAMPNNTVIMVSFAACFALALSNVSQGPENVLSLSTLSLIENTCGVLERVGIFSPHFSGLSKLFAQHIRGLLSNVFIDDMPNIRQQADNETNRAPFQNVQSISRTTSPNSPNPVHFSTRQDDSILDLTEEQIFELLSSTNVSQGMDPVNDAMFTNWMDWPTLS